MIIVCFFTTAPRIQHFCLFIQSFFGTRSVFEVTATSTSTCSHKYVNYKVQCHTSIIGLDANTFFSILVSAVAPPIEAKYLRTYLALTVLPDPLSPDMIIDWFLFSLSMGNRMKMNTIQFKTRDPQHLGLVLLNCNTHNIN